VVRFVFGTWANQTCPLYEKKGKLNNLIYLLQRIKIQNKKNQTNQYTFRNPLIGQFEDSEI
jgi:hypothetical protein